MKEPPQGLSAPSSLLREKPQYLFCILMPLSLKFKASINFAVRYLLIQFNLVQRVQEKRETDRQIQGDNGAGLNMQLEAHWRYPGNQVNESGTQLDDSNTMGTTSDTINILPQAIPRKRNECYFALLVPSLFGCEIHVFIISQQHQDLLGAQGLAILQALEGKKLEGHDCTFRGRAGSSASSPHLHAQQWEVSENWKPFSQSSVLASILEDASIQDQFSMH
eukprot:scaffold43569_cov21-Tisochrysis_lutea.AAC.1